MSQVFSQKPLILNSKNFLHETLAPPPGCVIFIIEYILFIYYHKTKEFIMNKLSKLSMQAIALLMLGSLSNSLVAEEKAGESSAHVQEECNRRMRAAMIREEEAAKEALRKAEAEAKKTKAGDDYAQLNREYDELMKSGKVTLGSAFD